MMKAIETKYNGNLFRSLLEARWAIFFDALRIKYRYEQFSFDLQGTWYCPDFLLPNHHYWIEIKGECPSEESVRKAKLLALSKPTESVIILWGGLPDEAYEPIGVQVIYNEWLKKFCLPEITWQLTSEGWTLLFPDWGHDESAYYTLMQAYDEARQYRFF